MFQAIVRVGEWANNWYQSLTTMVSRSQFGSRTLPWERGRSKARRGGREQVVQERVVRETTGSVVYPTLTMTNYTDWALVMRMNLKTQGLWAAIDPATPARGRT